MITVFTPTYNRAHFLPALYGSLLGQTNKDFEWLIVDDGSTDGTRDLVEGWIVKSPFPIRYSYQENGGKHRAINNGVQIAKGDWFFIVDSDDTLPSDSLLIARKWIMTVKDDSSFAGVCGMKRRKGFSPSISVDYIDTSPLLINKYLRSDKAEIFRTTVLRLYPFPEFPNEFFCAESLVWNRIGRNFNMRYFNETIYDYEYLDNGLTHNSIKNRRKSPTYATLVYKEEIMNSPLAMEKMRASVNFWRFVWLSEGKDRFDGLPIYAYPFVFFGLFFFLIDSLKLR